MVKASRALKACPFCGGRVLEREGDAVRCARCLAVGPRPGFTGETGGGLWNRRLAPACRIESIEYDDGVLQYRADLSCGHYCYCDELRGPNHCPECGALVERGLR